MLLGSAGTWPQHGRTGRKAWHFPTHGQPIGQTGRKDRKRKGTQGSEMIYANISMHVPKNVRPQKRIAALFMILKT